MRDFVPADQAQHETDDGGFRDFSPHPTPDEMKAMKNNEPVQEEELKNRANTPPAEEEADGYSCPDCNFVSKSSGGLKTHMRAKHED